MRVIVVLAAVALAACTSGGTLVASTASPSRTTASAKDYGLIRAEHPACHQACTMAATYLDTGQPTDLDPAWGDLRQQVLQLSGERRALYIRQLADGHIQKCDQAASQVRRSRSPCPGQGRPLGARAGYL